MENFSNLLLYNNNEYKVDVPVSPNDDRDWNATLCMFPIEKLGAIPDTLDYRPYIGAVRNQFLEGSCFHPETLISLLNGCTKTIKELSDGCCGEYFWVYSKDVNGITVPGKAKAFMTRKNEKLITVILDNGEKIKCTPDHKFMMRNGEYKNASNLVVNDSLMPLYKKISTRKGQDSGYEVIYDHNEGRFRYTHWMVASYIYKDLLIDKNINVIHHKNFVQTNNDPENLQPMSWSDHSKLHFELANRNNFKKWNESPERREWSKQNALRMYRENLNWNLGAASKAGKQAWENIKNNPEKVKEMKENFNKGRTKENIAKRAQTQKILCSTPEMKEKFSKQCKKMWEDIRNDSQMMEKMSNNGKRVGSNSGRYKIVCWAKEIVCNGKEINEINWNEARKSSGLHNYSKYYKIFKYFSTIDDLLEAVKMHNHKVVNIIDENEYSDVYCMEVEEHHNFALQSGVFVHNCASFAACALKEIQENVDCGFKGYFSTQFFYDLRGNNKNGMNSRTVMSLLQDVGVIREKMYRYGTHKEITEDMKKEAFNFRIKHYARVNTVLDAKNSLYQTGPLLLAVPVFGTSDMTRMWVPNGMVKGGHMMCIVGYTHNSFIVRNSWGETFGDNGYCYFPFDDWAYAWEVWTTTDAESKNVPPELLLGSSNFRGEKIKK